MKNSGVRKGLLLRQKYLIFRCLATNSVARPMRGVSRPKNVVMHKRKILLSLAMVFLFFFCQGQMTHRYSNGLYIIQYQSPEGLIILYVPRAEPGGWAAGSVELKAGGGSQRAMARSLDQLRAYTCNIEEETIRLDQSHFRIKTSLLRLHRRSGHGRF
jgi:hypothetical protein